VREALSDLLDFWRRPAGLKYVVLVAAAAAVAMLCHWDVRRNGASRRFVFQHEIRPKEVRSLVKNEAGAVAGALVFWTAAGLLWARRRREPLETGLARTAVGFAPGFIAGLGVAANLLGCEKHLARAIEALALAGVAVWLWAEMDLWPLRSAEIEPHPPRFYSRLLALAVAAYALLFGWLSVARYQTFFAAFDDLGMYTQQLWGNLHGHWFLCSGYKLPGDTMLAEHFMPLVLLLTPFYALWQDPRTVLIVQAAAVALSALPLYGIGVGVGLDRRAALFVAAGWLLNPLLQVGTLYDFHPDAFVPLFALGGFWAFLRLDEGLRLRREAGGKGGGAGPFPWRFALAYVLFILLWLSCKEDSMFGVVMVGLYVLAFRRRPLIGLATAAVGLAWGAVAIGWIIPHFRGAPYSHISRYYYLLEPFGWSTEKGSFFAALVKTALLHPLYMFGRIFTAPKVLALLKLFGPVVFLSFLGPKELLIAAPAVAANLLSGLDLQYGFRLHYPFAMTPFVYVAALVGIRNAAAWWSRRESRSAAGGLRVRPQLVLAAATFVAAAAFCRWFGETPLSRPFASEKVWRKPHHRRAAKFLGAVPPEASVCAQTGLAAHLTHRREIFEFPDLDRRPEYVLLDFKAPTWPLSKTEYPKRVRELLSRGDYGVVAAENGYVLLKRGYPAKLNAAAVEMLERYY